VVRTRAPVMTTEEYLEATVRVEQLGERLDIGDASRNLGTAEEALEDLR
jgi:hypothetical protein